MNEIVAAIFQQFGLAAAAALLAAGQIGVPLPTSLAILMVGALSSQGDIDVATAFLATLAGSVAGDQAGYFLGRIAYVGLRDDSTVKRRMKLLVDAARPSLERWGGSAVFLSRWLLTPLGPGINIAAGATGLSWSTFTFWAVLGEALWVAGYLSLGHIFASNIETLASALGNASMSIALAAVAAAIGWWLLRSLRESWRERD